MNKISIALITASMALAGGLAHARDSMKGQDMNNTGMSMEKAMLADGASQSARRKDAMRNDAMDKSGTKMKHEPMHGDTRDKAKKPMHAMDDGKGDAMRRMQ